MTASVTQAGFPQAIWCASSKRLTDFLGFARSSVRCVRRSNSGPGMRLLDAGCGIGLEATRLARESPGTQVTGLDRNADLLRIARQRTDPDLVNLRWLESDLTALELPDLSFDVIRSERVLMYLPDGDFERVLDELVRLLRPAGRLGLFELDYGATILTPGAAGDALLRTADDALFASLPQPLAGRRIPGLLAARGLREVAAEPFSFAVSEPVWRRIVGDTLMAVAPPDPAISTWLRERTAAAAKGQFVAAFTGVLTTASRPPHRNTDKRSESDERPSGHR